LTQEGTTMTTTSTTATTTTTPRKRGLLPDRVRETAMLRLFGLAKIPMLFFASPRVVEVTSERAEIVIPLSRMTRNHLRSMYFGVLAMGADCAGGVIAMKLIDDAHENISLIFGEFHAKFLKRAEGDVHFVCTDGPAIAALVQQAATTGERQTAPIRVVATVPSLSGDEPVAEFTLALSLKKKAKKG
jgi:acyl-coenzyme A thioesterase PaaI-like protein